MSNDPYEVASTHHHLLESDVRVLEALSREESDLNEEINELEHSVDEFALKYSGLCYVSEDDILQIPELRNRTVFLVRAPFGTEVEVPVVDLQVCIGCALFFRCVH